MKPYFIGLNVLTVTKLNNLNEKTKKTSPKVERLQVFLQ